MLGTSLLVVRSRALRLDSGLPSSADRYGKRRDRGVNEGTSAFHWAVQAEASPVEVFVCEVERDED